MKYKAKEAELKLRSWKDHIERLNKNIESEEWLLESLHQQADLTGDHEGFAPRIRQIEEKIRTLERQLEEVRGIVQAWRDEIDKIENEMSVNGCLGYI